jgi:hypothetical protein
VVREQATKPNFDREVQSCPPEEYEEILEEKALVVFIE